MDLSRDDGGYSSFVIATPAKAGGRDPGLDARRAVAWIAAPLSRLAMTVCEYYSLVIPDVFRDPLRGLTTTSRWMPEQVRHDEAESARALTLPPLRGGPLPLPEGRGFWGRTFPMA